MKFYCGRLLFRTSAIGLATGLLTACFHTDDGQEVTPYDHYAVIATQDGYTAGSVSLISLKDYSVDNSSDNFSAGSDASISTFEDNIYRIGRYGQDNITKLSIDDVKNPIWQYSSNEGTETGSNPYKLIFKDKDTAYLIRYGAPNVWVVNPNAASSDEFKTDELDLSSYALNDGNPEVSDGLIVDGKLYLVMQNLDTTNGWVPTQAWMAVFDTNDNTEIDTDNDSATPNGIALKTKNPSKLNYSSSNNTIYVSSIGKYAYGDSPADFSGGIEAVKLSDYSTSLSVDDGDDTTHPYGNIIDLAILSDIQGYFVGYESWGVTALYAFNPSTGAVNETPLAENMDIADIEIGPQGHLWVTNRNENGITIFDTTNNTVLKDLISTVLTPVDIEFVSIPQVDNQ